MNGFPEANELQKARNRVLRLYGQQKITRDQHDVGLSLLNLLTQTLSNAETASFLNRQSALTELEEIANGDTQQS